MAYGYNGGISSHKGALGTDAAASERLRTEAAIKEKQRIEKDRAKMELASVTRKYEHNKMEISHHQAEVRRLESEIGHDEQELQDIERNLKLLEEKEHKFKVLIGDSGTTVKEIEKKIQDLRMASDKKSHELQLLETQMQHISAKINSVKVEIGTFTSQIQKAGLDIKQIEAQGHTSSVNAERAKSEKMYKTKDVDNKKRAVNFMKEKRAHEIHEMDRLKDENLKFEVEIKSLTQKAK